jgi:hypothetical protein
VNAQDAANGSRSQHRRVGWRSGVCAFVTKVGLRNIGRRANSVRAANGWGYDRCRFKLPRQPSKRSFSGRSAFPFPRQPPHYAHAWDRHRSFQTPMIRRAFQHRNQSARRRSDRDASPAGLRAPSGREPRVSGPPSRQPWAGCCNALGVGAQECMTRSKSAASAISPRRHALQTENPPHSVPSHGVKRHAAQTSSGTGPVSRRRGFRPCLTPASAKSPLVDTRQLERYCNVHRRNARYTRGLSLRISRSDPSP